jgi:hypothetical protein
VEQYEQLKELLKVFANQLNAHHVNAIPDYTALQNPQGKLARDLVDFFELSEKKDLTLILLDKKDYAKYATIKRTCDFRGKQTICAVGKKLAYKAAGPKLQHLSSLALKVNMKMGGDNYWLDPTILDRLLGGAGQTKSTMIMGS